MKKILSILLVSLLALSVTVLFAACGDKNPDPAPTDPIIETTEPPVDDTPVDVEPSSTEPESEIEDTTELTTEAPTEPPTEPTAASTEKTGATEADTTTTTTKPANPNAPPENLDKLGKAEQLAYFNKAVNRVRTEKPGLTKDSLLKLGKLSFTGIVSAAQGLIDRVVANLMPGEWEQDVVKKGDGNDGKFMSDDTPFKLNSGDVTSISAKKSGANWVITVNIISETNPLKDGKSANARAYPIVSPQEVLDEITGFTSAISGDVNKCTLKFHSGYASVTVNPEGQVIAGEHFFKVDAEAKDVKLISIISTDVSAPQTTTAKYSDFKW